MLCVLSLQVQHEITAFLAPRIHTEKDWSLNLCNTHSEINIEKEKKTRLMLLV